MLDIFRETISTIEEEAIVAQTQADQFNVALIERKQQSIAETAMVLESTNPWRADVKAWYYASALLTHFRTPGYPQTEFSTSEIKLSGGESQQLGRFAIVGQVSCVGYEGQDHPLKGGAVSYYETTVGLTAESDHIPHTRRPRTGPNTSNEPMSLAIPRIGSAFRFPADTKAIMYDGVLHKSPHDAGLHALHVQEPTRPSELAVVLQELWTAASDITLNPALYDPDQIQALIERSENDEVVPIPQLLAHPAATPGI